MTIEGTLRRDEESQLEARSSRKRIFELDALRGVAAVTVVAYHTRLATRFGTEPRWFLRWLFAGPSAVALFFVLSGFVLSLPYWAGKNYSYWTYLRRRFVRIYLPFAAAALLSILGAGVFYRTEPWLSSWFNLTWHTQPTVTLALLELVAPLEPSVRGTFNTAFWSIAYEMMLSVVLPGIFWLMRRFGPMPILAAILLIAFAKPSIYLFYPELPFFGEGVQITALFITGMTLAAYRDTVSRYVRRHRAFALALLVLCGALYIGLFENTHFVKQHIEVAYRNLLLLNLAAVGLLIGAYEVAELARVLRNGVLEYLGKISYSLYLVHSVALFAVFALLYGKVPLWAVWGAVGLAAWGLAHALYVLVEAPCIALVRRIR